MNRASILKHLANNYNQWVYLMYNPSSNIYKIGMTARVDPWKRISEHKGFSPLIVHAVNNAKSTESSVLNVFNNEHKNKYILVQGREYYRLIELTYDAHDTIMLDFMKAIEQKPQTQITRLTPSCFEALNPFSRVMPFTNYKLSELCPECPECQRTDMNCSL